jgi:formylglycine-generating enzyme required for sulfatase activity
MTTTPNPIGRTSRRPSSLATAGVMISLSAALCTDGVLAAQQSADRSGPRSEQPPATAVKVASHARAFETASFEFATASTGASGDVENRRGAQARCYVERLGGGVTLELVGVPAGAFVMGSPDLEAERQANEGPQRRVALEGFLLGKYEVTQAQWRAVAMLPKVEIDISPEPSGFKGDTLPVGIVSWDDVQEFLARLSKATGRRYRLPSEAEWEYACRGGSSDAFAFGPNLTPDVANVDGAVPYNAAQVGATRGEPVAVGSLGLANGFGLYDMHGNALEWCADSWYEDYVGAPTDGSARIGGDATRRVIRGGSYKIYAGFCRSAARSGYDHDFRMEHVGFRIACDMPRSVSNR